MDRQDGGEGTYCVERLVLKRERRFFRVKDFPRLI
jgi:hypothetical protein